VILACLACLTWSCSLKRDSTGTEAVERGRIDFLEFDSPALKDNALSDNPRRRVAVYLPPRYGREPGKRYPTVYFLAGFNETEEPYLNGVYFNMAKDMDGLIASRAIRPMIVVVASGKNSFLGSFYADSLLTGNWETFICRDLVAEVDAAYLSLADRRSRGLAGFSMGGLGALHISMHNPAVFSAVFALSPMAMAPGDIEEALRSWKVFGLPMLRQAYVAAFAPALLGGYPFSPPTGPEAGPWAAELWERGLGQWDRKASKYAENLRYLRAIRIEAGNRDEFAWLPRGARYAAAAIESAGAVCEFASFQGTHESHVSSRMRSSLFPFFNRILDFD